MDKNKLAEYLTSLSKSVRIMQEYIDDNDVLRFYTGEISVLSKNLMSLFTSTD